MLYRKIEALVEAHLKTNSNIPIYFIMFFQNSVGNSKNLQF